MFKYGDMITERKDGATVFKCYDLDKWMKQNNAVIDDFREGCLQDNYLLSCKNGVAFVREFALNTNASIHVVEFVRYGKNNALHLVSKWYEFADDYDRAVNL